MTEEALRPWGARAQALTRLGFLVWSSCLVAAFLVRMTLTLLGRDVPEPVRLLLGVPGVTGFAVFVLAGGTWLAAEVGAGLREPR